MKKKCKTLSLIIKLQDGARNTPFIDRFIERSLPKSMNQSRSIRHQTENWSRVHRNFVSSNSHFVQVWQCIRIYNLFIRKQKHWIIGLSKWNQWSMSTVFVVVCTYVTSSVKMSFGALRLEIVESQGEDVMMAKHGTVYLYQAYDTPYLHVFNISGTLNQEINSWWLAYH